MMGCVYSLVPNTFFHRMMRLSISFGKDREGTKRPLKSGTLLVYWGYIYVTR